MTHSDDYEQIKDDWQYLGNIGTFTYTPQNGSAVPTVKGFREAIPIRQQAGGMDFFGSVGINQETGLFCVWDSTLGGLEINTGDELTDPNGTKWTIGKFFPSTWGTRWKLYCTRERR